MSYYELIDAISTDQLRNNLTTIPELIKYINERLREAENEGFYDDDDWYELHSRLEDNLWNLVFSNELTKKQANLILESCPLLNQ